MKRRSLVLLVFTLLVGLTGSAVWPAVVHASFLSSSQAASPSAKGDALTTLQGELENKYLADHLSALGLSPKEVRDRIDGLTAQQRGAVMDQLQTIQAGGGISMDTTTLVIVILLLVLLL